MSNLPMTIEQRVKEKIDVALGELIPEETLNELVAVQVKYFQTQHLPKLINETIADYFRKAIAQELTKSAYAGIWDTNGVEGASQAVKQAIIDSAPLILAQVIGAASQSVVNSLRNSLQTRY